MEITYTAILVILGTLAVLGLFVGVTNDAVNFLNSALGSKVSSRRTILIVASIGILVGVATSSGMMEVARSGMFYPEFFTFHEVMMLYLGVMFANVILLDLYNSWGLPTSTTVAMIFCLLGAAVAISLFKIAETNSYQITDLGKLINAEKAMGIISAILLSVVISFTFGSIIMYVSRAIFTFRYSKIFRSIGALWCGISLTAIMYFALFKGLKSLLKEHPITELIEANTMLTLLICWAAFSIILFFLQRFKVNILRITILAGTFALALAFAGNDLVNFIGVPIASFDAYQLADGGINPDMLMSALANDDGAHIALLLGAGIIMIITLWTSKKAMRVTETELALSAQDSENEEHYDSSAVSRSLVRAAININNTIEKIVPAKMRASMERRFEVVDIENTGAPFDMIRATLNLTVAAILISIATSMKLPLSTTYVCFMVAMGSSLADRAWGRETAVYRISGVITVIAGWFVTAIGGFIIALVVGLALIYGGIVAFICITVICAYMLIKSNFYGKTKEGHYTATKTNKEQNDILVDLSEEVCEKLVATTEIYDHTLVALFQEDRKTLRDMVKRAKELTQKSHDRKYSLMPTLRKLENNDIDTAHYYVQVVDFTNELSKVLHLITRSAYDHINNNHEGLSKNQIDDLHRINKDVETIFQGFIRMIKNNDFAEIDQVLEIRDTLFNKIAKAIKSELRRVNDNEYKTSTKSCMLYLSILNDTKSLILQSRNLMKAQRYFLEDKGILPRES